MKNLSFILFVFAALTVGSTITGCGGDDVIPVAKDTTDTDTTAEVTFKNKLKVGLYDYSVVEEPDRTNGNYNMTSGNTEIIVFGTDAKNGDLDYNFTFPGKTVGTYTRTLNPGTSFEIGIGTIGATKRTEYSANSTEFTINVTEYGEVGGRIKGTFSGKVKSTANQTVDVKNGVFDVERKPDL